MLVLLSVWQVLSESNDGEVRAPVCQSCVGIFTEPPQLDGEVQTVDPGNGELSHARHFPTCTLADVNASRMLGMSVTAG